VQFFSNWNKEGKTYVINSLKKRLELLDYSVSYINFSALSHSDLAKKDYLAKRSYLQFLDHDKDADILFVEIPSISDKFFNTSLFKTSDLSFFIADAKRTWSTADDLFIKKIKKNAGGKVKALLNRTHPENTQDVIGEIPKKRSYIRRYVKYKLLKKIL